MKNKIEDLRNHLFATTLEDLRDPDKPMDVTRAKAIVDVAQVIVDSAKAENQFMEITGTDGTGFIGERPEIGEVGGQVQPRLLRGGRR